MVYTSFYTNVNKSLPVILPGVDIKIADDIKISFMWKFFVILIRICQSKM